MFDDRSERHRPPWLAADLGGRPPEVAMARTALRGEPRAAALARADAHGCAAGARRARSSRHGARGRQVVRPRANDQLRRPVRCPGRAATRQPGVHRPGHRAAHRQPVPRTRAGDPVAALPAVVTRRRARTSSSTASPQPRSIRDEDPQAFATLTSTPVTFRYEDATRCCAPAARSSRSTPPATSARIRWNDRSIEPPAVAPRRRRRGVPGDAICSRPSSSDPSCTCT